MSHLVVQALCLFLKYYLATNFLVYIVLSVLKKCSVLLSDPSLETKRNVCLLIAHPDDECMFFGPVILDMMRRHNAFVLCLTSGNFYGLGQVRKKELKASCEKLMNGPTVEVVDEPDKMPDAPTNEKWDRKRCLHHIKSFLAKHSIDKLITFDHRGVSSHANHCLLSEIVRTELLKEDRFRSLEAYELVTVNVVRKYSFLFDLILSLIDKARDGRRVFISVSSVTDYFTALGAMFEHKSQLLWFRYIYLFTSRYLVLNTLKRI